MLLDAHSYLPYFFEFVVGKTAQFIKLASNFLFKLLFSSKEGVLENGIHAVIK